MDKQDIDLKATRWAMAQTLSKLHALHGGLRDAGRDMLEGLAGAEFAHLDLAPAKALDMALKKLEFLSCYEDGDLLDRLEADNGLLARMPDARFAECYASVARAYTGHARLVDELARGIAFCATETLSALPSSDDLDPLKHRALLGLRAELATFDAQYSPLATQYAAARQQLQTLANGPQRARE